MNKKQFLLCKKLFGGIDQHHFLNFHLSSMNDGEFIINILQGSFDKNKDHLCDAVFFIRGTLP